MGLRKLTLATILTSLLVATPVTIDHQKQKDTYKQLKKDYV